MSVERSEQLFYFGYILAKELEKENIMSKYEIKELFAMLVFSIINFAIAYFITTALGIQNEKA